MDYKSHRSLIESAIKAKRNSLLNEQDATPAANTVKPNPLLDPRAARETRETVARTQQLAQDLLRAQEQVDFERDLDKLGQNPARLNVVYKTGLGQPITPEDFSRLSDEDKKSLSGSINIEGVKTPLPMDYKSPFQIPSWTRAESAIIDNLKAEAAAAEEIDPDYKGEWTAAQMATIAPFIMADQVKGKGDIPKELEIGKAMTGRMSSTNPNKDPALKALQTNPEFLDTDTYKAVLRKLTVVNPDAMDPDFFRRAYAAIDASGVAQSSKDRAKAVAERMEKRHSAAREMIVDELYDQFKPTGADSLEAARKKDLGDLFDKVFGDITSTARNYRDISLGSPMGGSRPYSPSPQGRAALTTDPYDLVKEYISSKNYELDTLGGIAGYRRYDTTDKLMLDLTSWKADQADLDKFIESGEHSNFFMQDVPDAQGKIKRVPVVREDLTTRQGIRQLQQLMSGFDPVTDKPMRGFIERPDGTKIQLTDLLDPTRTPDSRLSTPISALGVDDKEFLKEFGSVQDFQNRLSFAPSVDQKTKNLVTDQILRRLSSSQMTPEQAAERLAAEKSDAARKGVKKGVQALKQFSYPIAVGYGAKLATDIASSWLSQEWQKRIKDQGIPQAVGYGAAGVASEWMDRSRDLPKDWKSLTLRGFIPSAAGGYLMDKFAKWTETEDAWEPSLVGLAATGGSPYIAKGVKGAASWLPNAIKATRFVQGAGAFASRIPILKVPGVVAAATGFGAEAAVRAGMAAFGETTVDKSVRELMLSPEFKGFENSADETLMNTPRQYGNRTLTPRQKLTTTVDLFREKLREGSIDFKPFKERDPTRYSDLPDVLESQQDKAKAYKIFIESELQKMREEIQKMREERDSTKPRPRSSGGGAGGPSAAQ
jgi:hypothetical protein